MQRMNKPQFVITIDGPTASGKSSVARAIAHELDIYHLNSGFLYRALAHILMRDHGYDNARISHPDPALCREILKKSVYTYADRVGAAVTYEGASITNMLKTPAVDRAASLISTDPYVRELIVEKQRELADDHSIVVDGRDAGTVVFPDAQFQFFLTASQDVRAERWRNDQAARGITVSHEDACSALAERDARDAERAIAPLHKAPRAVVIDTSDMSFDDVVRTIVERVRA